MHQEVGLAEVFFRVVGLLPQLLRPQGAHSHLPHRLGEHIEADEAPDEAQHLLQLSAQRPVSLLGGGLLGQSDLGLQQVDVPPERDAGVVLEDQHVAPEVGHMLRLVV